MPINTITEYTRSMKFMSIQGAKHNRKYWIINDNGWSETFTDCVQVRAWVGMWQTSENCGKCATKFKVTIHKLCLEKFSFLPNNFQCTRKCKEMSKISELLNHKDWTENFNSSIIKYKPQGKTEHWIPYQILAGDYTITIVIMYERHFPRDKDRK